MLNVPHSNIQHSDDVMNDWDTEEGQDKKINIWDKKMPLDESPS